MLSSKILRILKRTTIYKEKNLCYFYSVDKDFEFNDVDTNNEIFPKIKYSIKILKILKQLIRILNLKNDDNLNWCYSNYNDYLFYISSLFFSLYSKHENYENLKYIFNDKLYSYLDDNNHFYNDDELLNIYDDIFNDIYINIKYDNNTNHIKIDENLIIII
jgi:hypothetical protein